MPSEVTTKQILKMLEDGPAWPKGLEAMTIYRRQHDDSDGESGGSLLITFSRDGDAWVSTDTRRGQSMRFRTSLGGGSSVRTRNALVLLALAMKLDAEEEDQQRRNKRVDAQECADSPNGFHCSKLLGQEHVDCAECCFCGMRCCEMCGRSDCNRGCFPRGGADPQNKRVDTQEREA